MHERHHEHPLHLGRAPRKVIPLADLRAAAGDPDLSPEQAIEYLLNASKAPSSFQEWFVKIAPSAMRSGAELSAEVDNG